MVWRGECEEGKIRIRGIHGWAVVGWFVLCRIGLILAGGTRLVLSGQE